MSNLTIPNIIAKMNYTFNYDIVKTDLKNISCTDLKFFIHDVLNINKYKTCTNKKFLLKCIFDNLYKPNVNDIINKCLSLLINNKIYDSKIIKPYLSKFSLIDLRQYMVDNNINCTLTTTTKSILFNVIYQHHINNNHIIVNTNTNSNTNTNTNSNIKYDDDILNYFNDIKNNFGNILNYILDKFESIFTDITCKHLNQIYDIIFDVFIYKYDYRKYDGITSNLKYIKFMSDNFYSLYGLKCHDEISFINSNIKLFLSIYNPILLYNINFYLDNYIPKNNNHLSYPFIVKYFESIKLNKYRYTELSSLKYTFFIIKQCILSNNILIRTEFINNINLINDILYIISKNNKDDGCIYFIHTTLCFIKDKQLIYYTNEYNNYIMNNYINYIADINIQEYYIHKKRNNDDLYLIESNNVKNLLSEYNNNTDTFIKSKTNHYINNDVELLTLRNDMYDQKVSDHFYSPIIDDINVNIRNNITLPVDNIDNIDISIQKLNNDTDVINTLFINNISNDLKCLETVNPDKLAIYDKEYNDNLNKSDWDKLDDLLANENNIDDID